MGQTQTTIKNSSKRKKNKTSTAEIVPVDLDS